MAVRRMGIQKTPTSCHVLHIEDPCELLDAVVKEDLITAGLQMGTSGFATREMAALLARVDTVMQTEGCAADSPSRGRGAAILSRVPWRQTGDLDNEGLNNDVKQWLVAAEFLAWTDKRTQLNLRVG